MPELEPFDARLEAAVHAFADRAQTSVDAAAMALVLFFVPNPVQGLAGMRATAAIPEPGMPVGDGDGGGRDAHVVWSPPLTLRVWPVTHAASADARYTQAAPMSSGAPRRPWPIPTSRRSIGPRSC